MLTGLLGIRLLLLLGETVPLPAPPAVSQALQNVEVTSDAAGGDGFQMTFALSKIGPEYDLLLGGALAPFQRVVIGVLVGALPEVILDGVITHRQLTPSNTPGASTLIVTGRDISQMLDLEEKNEAFPNQPDFVIAARVLAGYALYGLIPQTTPTTDIPLFLDRIPRQNETDLRFLQRLAARNGFVFYVEPVTIGVNTAYWGPENRLGLPQPALTLGLGAADNVSGLHFSEDALAPVGTRATIVEPFTKSVVPIPALPALKIPPLALSPAPARRTTLARDTANRNPATAALSTLARATNAPDAVTGTGELDTVRYGRVLRARRLVGVRGAGFSFDGTYFVRRVTHRIAPRGAGEYKQQFSLSREGTGALPPVVVP